MVNKVDYDSLTNYFTQILEVKMKKPVLLACVAKTIFIGKSKEEEKDYKIK